MLLLLFQLVWFDLRWSGFVSFYVSLCVFVRLLIARRLQHEMRDVLRVEACKPLFLLGLSVGANKRQHFCAHNHGRSLIYALPGRRDVEGKRMDAMRAIRTTGFMHL